MLVEASEAMGALPLQRGDDPERYPSPGSVYARLQNIKHVDPDWDGAGLADGGTEQLREWLVKYSAQPEALAELVSAIKKQGRELREVGVSVDPDDAPGSDEGALLMTTHLRRERSRAARKKKAAVLAETGTLACEVCGFDFAARYGEIGVGFAECHHLRPLTEGRRTTKPEDLAIVCANCHRMIHRRSPPLSLLQVGTTLL
jgi:5-methylcytosine-specific restriction protein A